MTEQMEPHRTDGRSDRDTSPRPTVPIDSDSAEEKEDGDMLEKKVDTLADLMIGQVEDQKKRRKLITYVLGLVFAGGGASFAGYKVVIEGPPEVKPADVKEAVKESSDRLDLRVEAVERDVGALRKAAIEQQVQLVDSLDYIVDKIDTAHPEAPPIKEPPTLEAARHKADRAKAERDLFDDD